MSDRLYDIAIVGGGINGCGIARDAAGRGHSVFLCEQGDLAGATSSASTKLIHGGLRYLEYYEFRLVREALIEREVLLRAAPHIIWPMRFVLPHHSGLRPAWLLRLGLFLYDHIGGRKLLPGTKVVDLANGPLGKGLKPLFKKGFEYSDCWVQDSRLVVLNARDAQARGAEIRTRTACTRARREDDHWVLTLKDSDGETTTEISARILINAAGPWVGSFLSGAVGANTKAKVRMVQGSHIIVKRLFDHDRSYFFQNSDGRLVFTIPYERDFTLIGTTDRDYQGDPGEVAITQEETAYLCDVVSQYLEKDITPEDVVHTYSGVRPLYDDGASEAKAATRDYVLDLDDAGGLPPILNVFGGKITTYRKLAEHALRKLEPHLSGGSGPWTAGGTLPGGDFATDAFDAERDKLVAKYPFLAANHAERLMRDYGTEAHALLGEASSIDDLGHHFGADLYECEVTWLMDREWAVSADDVLWRRSKLRLRISNEEAATLDGWMTNRRSAGLHSAAE